MYLKKKELLEWLESESIKMVFRNANLSVIRQGVLGELIDTIQSGAFDANNHLRFPRQANKEAGWTISYDYIRNIDKHICNTGTDETSSYEAIEQVLLAVEALNAGMEKGA